MIFISALLSLVVAWLLVRPFLYYPSSQIGETDQNQLSELDRKDRSLVSLRDLEHDYATQKLSEEDYLLSRKSILSELAGIYKNLDTK